MSKIQLRRGTAAQWTSADPTLASGEVGVETDTNKFKIGDGSTAWVSLAYFAGTGLASIVEDTTPQLGGDLDVNGNAITGYLPSIDEDDMVSDSAAYVPTQQSVKAYVDSAASGISNIVEDTTPQLGGDLDVNGNAITGYLPSIDEDDMVSDSAAYVPTQQSVKAYVDASVGASLTQDVNQVAHGLAVGDAVKHNGTIWTKAQGTSTTTAGCIGVVSAVTDVDNFTYQFGGLLTSGTYTDGTAYFLSVATAGAIVTEPTYISGNVRQYIGMGTPDGLLLEITEGDEMLFDVIVVACSDENTALTTGLAKTTFRVPYACELKAVRASLTGAGSTSGTTTIDINESNVTLLSTKLTIDFGEKTSTTAATAAVISDANLADDAEITIDIDAVTGGADETGLKVELYIAR